MIQLSFNCLCLCMLAPVKHSAILQSDVQVCLKLISDHSSDHRRKMMQEIKLPYESDWMQHAAVVQRGAFAP